MVTHVLYLIINFSSNNYLKFRRVKSSLEIMNSFYKIVMVLGVVACVSSCSNPSRPNYQYMPDMYVPISYETYGAVEFLPSGMAAEQPVANTIPRGWMPYNYDNTPDGKAAAKLQPSPLDSLNMENDITKGGELYNIYCAICHGSKGDGQGILVQREKFLGVPNYNDVARDITVGDVYHTIYYGLNAMGTYANQLDYTERWQVSEYVMKLKKDLSK